MVCKLCESMYSLFVAAFARSPCTPRRTPTPRHLVGPLPSQLPSIGSFQAPTSATPLRRPRRSSAAVCAAEGQLSQLPSAAFERRSYSSRKALSTAAVRRSIRHSSRKALSWLPSSWPAPASWRTFASWAWTRRTRTLSELIVSCGRQTREFRASNCRRQSPPRRPATKVAWT